MAVRPRHAPAGGRRHRPYRRRTVRGSHRRTRRARRAVPFCPRGGPTRNPGEARDTPAEHHSWGRGGTFRPQGSTFPSVGPLVSLDETNPPFSVEPRADSGLPRPDPSPGPVSLPRETQPPRPPRVSVLDPSYSGPLSPLGSVLDPLVGPSLTPRSYVLDTAHNRGSAPQHTGRSSCRKVPDLGERHDLGGHTQVRLTRYEGSVERVTLTLDNPCVDHFVTTGKTTPLRRKIASLIDEGP